MNKFLTITLGMAATAASVVSGVYTPANAEQWVRILTVQDKVNDVSAIYFVDVSSIKKQGSTRSYWASVVFDKPISAGDRSGVSLSKGMVYLSVNCRNKADYRVHTVVMFDQNDRELVDMEVGGVPSSSLERGDKAMINYVCSRR